MHQQAVLVTERDLGPDTNPTLQRALPPTACAPKTVEARAMLPLCPSEAHHLLPTNPGSQQDPWAGAGGQSHGLVTPLPIPLPGGALCSQWSREGATAVHAGTANLTVPYACQSKCGVGS